MSVRILLAVLGLCVATASHADRGTLAVSATVLSRSLCIITGQRAMTLAFGAIDPSSTTSKTASVTTTIACIGNQPATFSITTDSGQHELGTGNFRMQNGAVATEFLPYSLSISPASATVPQFTNRLITITGTIAPAQFQNVRFGSYADTVAITLNP